MNILVGYNGGEACRIALSLAKDMAETHGNAFVYVITSMKGGASEKQADIIVAEKGLESAENFFKQSNINYDCQQSVRGLSPGEDLVKFAEENNIDHIFLGVKKISRLQKAILGSTVRYVILNAPCPVTTVKFNIKTVSSEDLLKDRKILAVDDEPDILETIEDILDMCDLDTAGSFDAAKEKILHNKYDLVILDIMGINGYELLAMAEKHNLPALMLTAHALTPENMKESLEKGADSYIPKDELANLPVHAADVIRARIRGEHGYGTWFSRLKPFFEKSFGKDWQNRDAKFWDSFNDRYGG